MKTELSHPSALEQTETTIPGTVGERCFYSVSKLRVPTVSLIEFNALIDELHETFFISELQVCEAGGAGLAMVVRHSMGQLPDGATVTVLVGSGLCAEVALFAARHLANAGAHVHVITFGSTSGEHSIQALAALGIPITVASSTDVLCEKLSTMISRSQHLILGIDSSPSLDNSKPIRLINESPVPVHVVQCPWGIDPGGQGVAQETIFASTTLSLGVPLHVLKEHRDQVGRHYVCDISIPTRLTDIHGNTRSLFSDQPIQTLLYDLPGAPH